MALAKIVGFDVAPVTAQSAIRAAKAPSSSSSRESVSTDRHAGGVQLLEAVHRVLPLSTGTRSSSGTSGSARSLSSTATRSRISRWMVGHVPHVHVHTRQDLISREPEGDEFVARGVATEDDLSVRAKPEYSMPTSY